MDFGDDARESSFGMSRAVAIAYEPSVRCRSSPARAVRADGLDPRAVAVRLSVIVLGSAIPEHLALIALVVVRRIETRINGE
jgi:hypothetical protein